MKLRAIGKVVLFIAFLIVLFSGFYYAGDQSEALLCQGVEITVLDSGELAFVTRASIRRYLQNNFPKMLGSPLLSINTAELEKHLDDLSGVQKAEVYYGVDGYLRIRLQQREPMFRIVTNTSASCYVDRYGYTFPVDRNYTAHVLLVTGDLQLPAVGGRLQREVSQPRGLLPQADSVEVCHDQNWNRMFQFLSFLHSDPLWRSQFAQVYVANWQHVELVPRVGGQIIILGDLNNYEYKLNKLYSAYRSLLRGNVLDDYSALDLQYSNQVIGIRR